MANLDEAVVAYAIYEDATEYCGVAEVTLPDVEFLTNTITGSGMAGEITEVIMGWVKSMTVSMSFNTFEKKALQLMEPRIHEIDMRAAHQYIDNVAGTVNIGKVKHVMKIRPVKTSVGKLAGGSTGDASGEYAVMYYAIYIDGTKQVEIDPLNFICYINGTDYLEDVRAAIGK